MRQLKSSSQHKLLVNTIVDLINLLVGKNYSSGKIIRREKLFVGENCIYIFVFRRENHSSGKIIRRGKLFVGENYSLGKIIRRGNLFVGEIYSSGKFIPRGNLFVGEIYSSGKFIRRGKLQPSFFIFIHFRGAMRTTPTPPSTPLVFYIYTFSPRYRRSQKRQSRSLLVG